MWEKWAFPKGLGPWGVSMKAAVNEVLFFFCGPLPRRSFHFCLLRSSLVRCYDSWMAVSIKRQSSRT
jgi:hypothetical protein